LFLSETNFSVLVHPVWELVDATHGQRQSIKISQLLINLQFI
jgi:hypothetical protein